MMKAIQITMAIAAFAVMSAHGDIVYQIDFNQFAAGAPYTSVGGGPDDFSSYTPNYNTNVTSAYIAPSFGGLLDQPLVNTAAAGSAFGIYSMAITTTTQSLLTLNMQVLLDTTTDAGIFFESPVVGASYSTVGINFSSWEHTFLISSRSGLIYAATTMFSTNGSYSPNAVIEITFTLNMVSATFSASVDGNVFAAQAPFDTSLGYDNAEIRLGDIGTLGHGGQSAIDNITLDISQIPEPSTWLLFGLGFVAMHLGQRKRRTIASTVFLTRGGFGIR